MPFKLFLRHVLLHCNHKLKKQICATDCNCRPMAIFGWDPVVRDSCILLVKEITRAITLVFIYIIFRLNGLKLLFIFDTATQCTSVAPRKSHASSSNTPSLSASDPYQGSRIFWMSSKRVYLIVTFDRPCQNVSHRGSSMLGWRLRFPLWWSTSSTCAALQTTSMRQNG